MPVILTVEDDPKIAEAITKALTLGESFVCEWVASAEQALGQAVRLKPDLILLDIRFPDGDGRVVIKALKKNASTRGIPVILLTGMASEGDRVLGLNLGADDYIVKPFGAMELVARIQAVLRRYRPDLGREGALSIGGLKLDPANRLASIRGRALKLQPKEFELLYLLASHPGRALSRSFLIENSSSYGMPLRTRSLDTHIKNLRKKLGGQRTRIETVPKLGYRFAP